MYEGDRPLNKAKASRKSFRLAFAVTVRSLCSLMVSLDARAHQRLMMYHTNPAQARTIPPPTAAKIMCLPPFPRKLRPVSGRGNKVTYLEVTSL